MNRSNDERTDQESPTRDVDKLVRTAILCTIVGMLLVLIFLIAGFQSWSVGLGVFLGMPVMILGVGLYVIAVFRDLKNSRVFDDSSSSSSTS